MSRWVMTRVQEYQGNQLHDLFSIQHMESNPVFNGCPSITTTTVLPKVPLLSEASRFRDLSRHQQFFSPDWNKLQLRHRTECNRIVRNTCIFFDRSLAHNFQQSNIHNRSNMTTDNHTQRRKYRRNSAWSSFQSKCRNAGCTHAVIHTVIAKDYLLQQRQTGRRGSVLIFGEVFLGRTQQPSAPPAVMAKYTNAIGELLESLKQEQVTTVQRHATILHWTPYTVRVAYGH